MAFKEQADRQRRESLGTVRYNDLVANQAHNRGLFLREHLSSGGHNLLRAPRAVATVAFSAGSYSLAGATPGIVSVSSPGTGLTTLTLDAVYFPDATSICVETQSANNPAIVLNWEIVSNTSVNIAAFRLDTMLLANATYYVRIFANPAPHAPTLVTTSALPPGSPLTATAYNAIVENSLRHGASLATDHLSDGQAHRLREFPSSIVYVELSGLVTYTPTVHKIGEGGSIPVATRLSAGNVRITLPTTGGASLTNFSAQIFVTVAGAPGEHWRSTAAAIVNDGNSFTQFDVWLFRRGISGWSETDASFWYVFHCVNRRA
jgi:hypothetical protein